MALPLYRERTDEVRQRAPHATTAGRERRRGGQREREERVDREGKEEIGFPLPSACSCRCGVVRWGRWQRRRQKATAAAVVEGWRRHPRNKKKEIGRAHV